MLQFKLSFYKVLINNLNKLFFFVYNFQFCLKIIVRKFIKYNQWLMMDKLCNNDTKMDLF